MANVSSGGYQKGLSDGTVRYKEGAVESLRRRAFNMALPYQQT